MYGSTGVLTVGTKFHYIMVAVTAVPKFGSIQYKIFKCDLLNKHGKCRNGENRHMHWW